QAAPDRLHAGAAGRAHPGTRADRAGDRAPRPGRARKMARRPAQEGLDLRTGAGRVPSGSPRDGGLGRIAGSVARTQLSCHPGHARHPCPGRISHSTAMRPTRLTHSTLSLVAATGYYDASGRHWGLVWGRLRESTTTFSSATPGTWLRKTSTPYSGIYP